MSSSPAKPEKSTTTLDRILSIEIVRVTERAAVAAARLSGRGNEKDADQAAVDAMRRELNKLATDGTVGMRAEGGPLLNAPDVYMEKIAIGPGYPKDVVDLDAPADQNIRALAKAKGVRPEDITALILDRPRHADLVAAVRKVGAAIRFITDGDVAGVIHTADPESTGIDIYMGVGGAPEGVLAAAALACIGGQIQGRLVLDTEEKRERAAKMGIKDPRKKYAMQDMVQGDCVFSATGVTTGSMLRGGRFRGGLGRTD